MKDKPDFDKLFNILSSPEFLSMEGLAKEVPFFVHAYNPSVQTDVYKGVNDLVKRLETEGVGVLLIGLYDMVIEYFEKSGELDDIFTYEKEVTKDELFREMVNIFNADDVVKPYFKEKLEEKSSKVVILYQVGEVFPFLRTHNILNWIQSVVKDIPLVVFFPGEYITSSDEGFKLNLFGKFQGPYYRAFPLEHYAIRSKISD